MSHPRHPRFATVMLEALAPRSDFREALLGDLAEEFVFRAERDGVASARRWYPRDLSVVSRPLLAVHSLDGTDVSAGDRSVTDLRRAHGERQGGRSFWLLWRVREPRKVSQYMYGDHRNVAP